MQYDVAAYIWPAYTGDEPRTRAFWPEGMGEWQTVRSAQPNFPGMNGRANRCGVIRTRPIRL